MKKILIIEDEDQTRRNLTTILRMEGYAVRAAAEMPVIVGHQSESFAHSGVLISLHNTCLPFFSRFERVIEIISKDSEDARLGRERYSFYRDRGYALRHFDLSNKS